MPRGCLRSARARVTRARNAEAVRSRSPATRPTVWPSSNTRRTAPARGVPPRPSTLLAWFHARHRSRLSESVHESGSSPDPRADPRDPVARARPTQDIAKKWPSRAGLTTRSKIGVRCKCLRSGGGRGIRTPKGLAARWISSPLPYQLRLALRVRNSSYLRYIMCSPGRRTRDAG